MDLLRNLVVLRNDSGFDLSLPDPQQADQGSRDVGRGEEEFVERCVSQPLLPSA